MNGHHVWCIVPIMLILVLFLPVSATEGSLAQTTNIDMTSGPYVDRMIYRVITQDDQHVQALQDGDIDLIGDMVDPQFLTTLSEAENIEVAQVLRNGYGYLSINCDKYPFNITAFRRAFAFALDKEAISNDMCSGPSVPQDSCVPQINPLSIEGQLPYSYYEADIALGNQLLDEAGFHDVDNDNVREAPNGMDFDVLIEYPYTSTYPTHPAQRGAEALAALGINATAQEGDINEYMNRIYHLFEYDVFFLGSNFNNLDLDWLGYEFWSEYADEPYWNFPNFRNASYDSWRDQLLHATYLEGAGGVMEAAHEMQKIWIYQSPEIICYEGVQLTAFRTDSFEGI